MDVFKLRNKVIADYSSYIESFLKILDPKINDFVKNKLADGVLWPDPLLQLSPAYQAAQTVKQLVKNNVLHPTCGTLFRAETKSLLLHQHQSTAIGLAAQGHNYVVTTGTGSGKSLTYLIPIFDYVLKNQPEKGQVRAIIVYPMNALINSQAEALDRFVKNLGGPDNCPVKYARYTGQESDSRKREIQNNPPHILLTNYVMLELMLTRPEERPFVEAASTALQFLVLDELHTYRGRQGADVALLVRRLRERCGNPGLQCIGTSATMSSGTTRAERAAAVAEVASKIFGTPVLTEHVIDETLRRTLSQTAPASPEALKPSPEPEALRKVLTDPAPLPAVLDWETLRKNPLAVWIEDNFGLEVESDGRLKRREPLTFMEGVRRLQALTGVPADTCARKLQQIFIAGSKARSPEDIPGFAFKLHQFFSQGGSVYSTLETPDERYLTLEGQHYAPGNDTDKLLFPLVFCRECGQEHYLCTYNARFARITPRPPLAREEQNNREELDGYLLVDLEGFWSDEQIDLLPETWFKELKRGRELKPEYAMFRPRRLWVQPDGNLVDKTESAVAEAIPCWFIPVPFLTCLRCGEIYTKRQSDFSKLSRLSSEGRSTATTLLSLSAITQMRSDNSLKDYARKLLSFTDNRQDASLQAGHFNDFVEVGLLRAAIYRALKKAPQGLTYTEIAPSTVDELDLPETTYAKETSLVKDIPFAQHNRDVLQSLIEYRIYEDLRRGWRVTQPNLEQCGLLLLTYKGLEKVCANEEVWKGHNLLAQTSPEVRAGVVQALLDYMRRELAINAQCLEPRQQEALKKRVRDALKEPWAFDENELLYSAACFVLPGTSVSGRSERSLGINTSLGRYLKSHHTWPALDSNLDQEEYSRLVLKLVEILRGTGYLIEVEAEKGPAVQVRSDAMLWCAGEGLALARDPIRSRRMSLDYARTKNTPNRYFGEFYRTAASTLQNIEGREHTGQVKQQDREKREAEFRSGKLSALFCSPTMELGIDIAELNVVHLRNVPPTPANYAQRSGRAGRSGQPALVATYCSVGSGHDQYFFRRPRRMVAGAVVPPRIDLGNEEMVKAHIHAVWLSVVGLTLGRSMIQLVDTADPANNYPLLPEVKAALELSPARQQECIAACTRILSSALPDLSRNGWELDKKLPEIIASAPQAFDIACNRWRDLYSAAEKQLQEARAVIDRRYQSRSATVNIDAEEARRREFEALRQKDLLCNTFSESQQGDSDFYPYRYFASEGFLPGYNFPRLPVQAFLSTSRESGTFLSRPRFLALTEFGPRNVIYHEGGKYRVIKIMLPGGSANSRLVTAKLCQGCGYFHEGQSALTLEVCEHCGTRLDGDNCLTIKHLFEMTTVATQRIERITSEEEERVREGYFITSHFRFAGPDRVNAARTYEINHKETLLEMCYASAATLWRINHRWRRSNTDGFTLDLKKGIWAKKPGDELDNALDAGNTQVLSGVRLMVRDTRNLLLVQPDQSGDEEFLASLQFALQRGIEAVFQVEEQELVSERIGQESQRRIMFWEATEGGVGVLLRLVEEPKALAEVARAALEICHFDPFTGEESGDVTDCGQACYRCLLSYSNQPDHPYLKRHLVHEVLMRLAQSVTEPTGDAGKTSTSNESANGSAGSHYERLLSQTAPGSFARQVLEQLHTTGRRLPDAVRPTIEEAEVRPDFYFNIGMACIFCDEVPPSQAEKISRYELADQGGYRVIALRREQDLEVQLKRYSDILTQ